MSIKELTGELASQYIPLITAAKRNRILSIEDPYNAAQALLCEILARQCLSQLCDAPEFSFQLLLNPDSKSIVSNFNAEISLSTSGEYVACCASYNFVGIGIAESKPFTFKQAQEIFSDAEIRMLYSDSKYSFSELVNQPYCDEVNVKNRFAVLNSLKDAHFYSTGRGIRADKRKVTFEIKNNEILCSDRNCIIKKSTFLSDKNVALSIIERCKHE